MTYRVLENTLVQLPLGRSALPQLVVVIVEALPVGTELFQTGLVDIVDAVRVPVVSIHARGVCMCSQSILSPHPYLRALSCWIPEIV